jgi:hypothetical protein
VTRFTVIGYPRLEVGVEAGLEGTAINVWKIPMGLRIGKAWETE